MSRLKIKKVSYSLEYDRKDIQKKTIHRNQKKTYRVRRTYFSDFFARKQILKRIPRG